MGPCDIQRMAELSVSPSAKVTAGTGVTPSGQGSISSRLSLQYLLTQTEFGISSVHRAWCLWHRVWQSALSLVRLQQLTRVLSYSCLPFCISSNHEQPCIFVCWFIFGLYLITRTAKLRMGNSKHFWSAALLPPQRSPGKGWVITLFAILVRTALLQQHSFTLYSGSGL